MSKTIAAFEFTYAQGRHRLCLKSPLTLPSHHIWWVVGASGCGKSTLLNLLKGFYPEFVHGTLLDIEETNQYHPREDISSENADKSYDKVYVKTKDSRPIESRVSIFKEAALLAQNPQTQMLHPSIGEEFVFSLENQCADFKTIHNQQHCLYDFGFHHNLNQAAQHDGTQLSHGQQQRLLLASLLATQPDYLMLDEPSAFLDHQGRVSFYQTLQALKTQRVLSMLIIDHHDIVQTIADACLHIDANGNIELISVQQWLSIQSNALAKNAANNVFHDIPNIHPLFTNLTLKAENLCVGYRKNNQSIALFKASFELKSGECAIVTAPNGSGKSTFFNTLAGIQKPLHTSLKHSISLVNDVQTLPIQNHLSYVMQYVDSHFLFDTLGEELSQITNSHPRFIFPKKHNTFSHKESLDYFIKQFNLAPYLESSPHRLSEGQKRRLTLLYPLMSQHPIILMDEPSFGQDAIQVSNLISMIQFMQYLGFILIIISHDEYLQQQLKAQLWSIENQQLVIKNIPQSFKNTCNANITRYSNSIINFSNPCDSDSILENKKVFQTPILTKPFHDAHLLFLFILFFLIVAFPLQWYSVVLMCFVFQWLAFWQGVSIFKIIKVSILALALSLSIWLLNILFHPNFITPKQALQVANQSALRIWSLTTVSLLSAQMLSLKHVVIYILQKGKLSLSIGYAMLTGLAAIDLMRAENTRIRLNAKLRQLSWKQRHLTWVPLLIFALRHAKQGAMNLRARGLNTQKSFYYSYVANSNQTYRIIFALLLLLTSLWIGEYFIFYRI